MNQNKPEVICRKDYKKPDFLIPTIDLEFDLHDSRTRVISSMKIVKQKKSKSVPLVLNGEKISLISVKINGEIVDESGFKLDDEFLTISDVPDDFILSIENEIDPLSNKALEGLYKSGNIFCTQNEPEGFRKITYFVDRPDVMSRFTTKITARKNTCPVLLSNGNPADSGDLDGERHWVLWEDPFPKPAYLFALVAGDLGLVSDKFITRSGREIDLRIYCDRGNEDRCFHAMESLKKSMKWDEERFELEYDLDIYMIVAVDSFNMGAMENKGLNIFNSHYVLANPETATDVNYLGIEGVIGHEYFHNWTGNRVTCRDWFQLTLKEGLTVFRDQEFSSDIQSRPVKRISDVNDLRSLQFVEDSGPNSHPIRPESYMEINNFYTLTVYEKGAEVIRMIHTILGEEGFQRGMKRYFELYDGQAVTCDDFVHAMESANDADLSQFKLWYSQSGTPMLNVDSVYDEKNQSVSVRIRQSLSNASEQGVEEPMHIPLAIGLVDRDGIDQPLNEQGDKTTVLHLKNKEEEFVFTGISDFRTVSLNRGFSSPVRIESNHTLDDLIFLFAEDSDEFCRWEAGQKVAKHFLVEHVQSMQNGDKPEADGNFLGALGSIIRNRDIESNYKSLVLRLPSESILGQEFFPVDFDSIHNARQFMKKEISNRFSDDLLDLYNSLEQKGDYLIDIKSIGERSLRLLALDFLAESEEKEMIELCSSHFLNAGNMTDEIGTLAILSGIDCPEREDAMERFYHKWKKEVLVMTKWFSVQASSSLDGTLDAVKKLEKDPVFDIKVPNLVRSLYGAFAGNAIHFNDVSGKGYEFISDKIIEIDSFNPSISSGLSKAFKLYSRVSDERRNLMKTNLERIIDTEGLSKNTYEIVFKTLNSK